MNQKLKANGAIEINVDGKNSEWQNGYQYYNEENTAMVSMYNDDSYLYIILSSHDRKIKRLILNFGLTVWFDQEGGKEKALGIRFPVGMPCYYNSGMRMPIMHDPSGDDSDQFRKMLENPQMELQLLGPRKNEQKTMLHADVGKYGINTKMGEVDGNIVYELKVPLTQNEQTRYAIRPDPAKRIGVGFETGKSDLKGMKKRFGKRGGGRSEMGRRPPDGMSGRRGGKMPEPFELWTKVQLASRP